ncbi:MAG: hypothetical protein ACRBBK_05290 [Paracoccaceae bacterium]
MADAHTDKFSLVYSDAERRDFELEESALDFTTVVPEKFIWNTSSTIPPEFIPAALFSAFQERYIGYDPLNRDRFEVRIYTGRIFQDRVALAADYGGLFAISWGKLNFGIEAHDRDFGEILGGDNSSGIMIVNRISVFRRGDEILVIRSKFHAEHFKSYAADIAKFIGSIQFTEGPIVDPIESAFVETTQPVSPAAPAITYQLPGNWARLDVPQPEPKKGNYQLWFDKADPNGNGGILLTTIPPLEVVPEGAEIKPDPQEMIDFGAALANVALENMLPDKEFRLEGHNQISFDTLDPITAFNRLYTFRALVGEEKWRIDLIVLLTWGKDGSVIATTAFEPSAIDLYLRGTAMHVKFAQRQTLSAMEEYWAARQEK